MLLLNDQDKELLRLPGDGVEPSFILADVHRLTAEKQKVVQDKAWKINFGGRRIALKDVIVKMVSWLKSFEAIGDILVSMDPGHAALPWAAVKLLLQASQVVTRDQSQMGLVLIGLEQVACLITRCKVYEQLYLDNIEPQKMVHVNVMKSLSQVIVQLYAKLLSFLAHYIRLMNKNGVVKALHALLNPDEISDMLSEIGRLETRTIRDAGLCGKNMAQLAIHQTNEKFQEAREQLHELVSRMDTDTLQLWKKLNEDERVKILQWISDIPYESDHYTAKSGRIEGTGGWLIQHETYKAWRDAKESTVLWLNGIPGAGKTKLSSKVVDDLLQVVEGGDAGDMGFAYFYCDRNRADHQDPVAILRSLIRQLCAPCDTSSIDACAEHKYMVRKRKGFARDRLSGEECHELLLQLVGVQSGTYLVIDGLDECDRETRHVLMNILDDLIDKSGHPVKIYIASRTDQDLRSRYQGGTHLEVTANDNQADIETFVIEKMKQSDFCNTKMTSTVREQILTTFHDKSQGMFQWAVLHISELLALKRNNDILKYLHQLPRGLEAAYDKILQNISNQNGSQKDVAFAAFKIVMVSRRPLSPYELVAAVVQDPEMDFCIDGDVDIDYLLEVCHNLLVVTDGSLEKPVDAEHELLRADYTVMGGYQYQKVDDPRNSSRPVKTTRSGTTLIGPSSICRFSHLSVQEYLESKHWSTHESEAFMAGICLRTLLSFRISDNPTDWDLRRRGIATMDEIVLGDRTILSVAELEKSTTFRVIWEPEAHDEDGVTALEQIPDSHDDRHHEIRGVKSQAPPFQCFVEFSHDCAYDDNESYSGVIFDPYIEGYRNTGVEGWASYASHTFDSHLRCMVSAKGPDPATAGLLVEFLGKPGESSNSYRAWTVLNQNNYNLTKRRPNTSPKARNLFSSRALLRPISEPALGCAIIGLKQILQVWLEEGSLNSNLKNDRGDSLLVLAIESEHAQVCDLLLRHGADANISDFRGMSPLNIAVGKRNKEIVTALLKSGASPNFHSSQLEDYPLIRAVKLDDIGIARELLRHGADVSLGYQKITSSSPLIKAVLRSNMDLVALLLEYVQNLPRWQYHGIIWYALEEAVKVVHNSAAAVLGLLMPHATELKGLSVLHTAVMEGNWTAANALIKLKMDVNTLNGNFNTPLLCIMHSDCEEKSRKVKQLIEWGANVNATDIDGRTALYVCINRSIGREEIISLLLNHGANPNAVDKKDAAGARITSNGKAGGGIDENQEIGNQQGIDDKTALQEMLNEARGENNEQSRYTGDL
ncbi:ankyrin repeat domain-containing protein [Trichoderma breve]|uniref:Ankyrin repeat domain-containing protein n=1 Tax=Trichoderma breve TaxID=2034170 RepID=A0A9W9BA60_9HYPO|nr:ankyrin repeat domain-containing protein [Trichoderma breve]KAJ4856183.1 ankyrin repeat domain-containing protein [Trichoderma breve]